MMKVPFYEGGESPADLAPTPQEQEALAAMSKGKFRLAMRIWTDVLEKDPWRALLLDTASWNAHWNAGCVLAEEKFTFANNTGILPPMKPTPLPPMRPAPPSPKVVESESSHKHQAAPLEPTAVVLEGKARGHNPNELQPAHVNLFRRQHRNQEYDRLAW